MKASEYYLQDNRGSVGNDMMWWAKDGKGYTTDIDRAEVFSEFEAMQQHESRSTDVPWPKDYIDSRTTRVVDIQHVDRSVAMIEASNNRS